MHEGLIQNEGAFLFGISPSLHNSALLSSADCYRKVGENTGNLAFHWAISQQLGLFDNVEWSEPDARFHAGGRLAVMPCANQVGVHIDMRQEAARIAGTQMKLVALGLGAQSNLDMTIPDVPEGTIAWIRELVRRAPNAAPNISVRGEFSRRVMESLGFADNVEVLGCPTLFINSDRALGEKLAARFDGVDRVCVVAGHYQWTELARLEASLASIAASTDGAYVMQSPFEMVALGRGDLRAVSDQVIGECRDFCAPHLDVGQFKAWLMRHARSFFDVSAWMEYMRRYDLVIGARIHGVMLALQAGIPAICIAHDSRTLELCQIMKVPFLNARDFSDGITKAQLAGLWEFDGAQFDRNRQELAQRYRDFLARNGLVCRTLIE